MLYIKTPINSLPLYILINMTRLSSLLPYMALLVLPLLLNKPSFFAVGYRQSSDYSRRFFLLNIKHLFIRIIVYMARRNSHNDCITFKRFTNRSIRRYRSRGRCRSQGRVVGGELRALNSGIVLCYNIPRRPSKRGCIRLTGTAILECTGAILKGN